MRDIDQAHDPENQRQPCREQGIETPEERSLNHRPDPFDHWGDTKIGCRDILPVDTVSLCLK